MLNRYCRKTHIIENLVIYCILQHDIAILFNETINLKLYCREQKKTDERVTSQGAIPKRRAIASSERLASTLTEGISA